MLILKLLKGIKIILLLFSGKKRKVGCLKGSALDMLQSAWNHLAWRNLLQEFWCWGMLAVFNSSVLFLTASTWEARCQSESKGKGSKRRGGSIRRRGSQLLSEAGDSVEISGLRSLTEAVERAFHNDLTVGFANERMVFIIYHNNTETRCGPQCKAIITFKSLTHYGNKSQKVHFFRWMRGKFSPISHHPSVYTLSGQLAACSSLQPYLT